MAKAICTHPAASTASFFWCLLAVIRSLYSKFFEPPQKDYDNTTQTTTQQTLDIITSRNMAVIFKCNGTQIHTTSMTAMCATNVEINVWTTPKQHFHKTEFLYALLTRRRQQRYQSVRRRLVYDD